MFKTRSYEKELMDDFGLSNDALRKNLEELEVINYWLGGNQVITNALNKLLKKGIIQPNQPLKIADLGSGGGDVLRVMAKWGRKKNISLELTGIDANEYMISYATQRCQKYPEIAFEQTDIFSEKFKPENYDLITCSLFCHHFTDEELHQLFSKLYQTTQKGVIINDLHRHPFAYYSIKWLTRLFNGSYLVKNDAPLSVLRAFIRQELATLLQQASIPKFRVQWLWAFRYQVIFLSKKNRHSL